MKTFTDLHLRAPKRSQDLEEMLRLASGIGYSLVGISFDENAKDDIRKARAVCSGLGLDMATRFDLQPESVGSLLKNLGSLRHRFEVIAVTCSTKEVARQAANDRRIDLLNYPSDTGVRRRLRFDRHEAVLASGSLTALEVDAQSMLSQDVVKRARLISLMRGEIQQARKLRVPVTISSGARDPYGLRTPRDLASLLTLVDTDWASALGAVSDIPTRIVIRNREKLERSYVSPGVRTVEDGTEWRTS